MAVTYVGTTGHTGNLYTAYSGIALPTFANGDFAVALITVGNLNNAIFPVLAGPSEWNLDVSGQVPGGNSFIGAYSKVLASGDTLNLPAYSTGSPSNNNRTTVVRVFRGLTQFVAGGTNVPLAAARSSLACPSVGSPGNACLVLGVSSNNGGPLIWDTATPSSPFTGAIQRNGNGTLFNNFSKYAISDQSSWSPSAFTFTYAANFHATLTAVYRESLPVAQRRRSTQASIRGTF